MPQFKNNLEKRKYYKKLEKERAKQEKELDKEVEKEYKEMYPKDHSDISNKLAKKMAEFFDLVWPDDEEQEEKEFDSLLTEQEKKELEDMKKEEKKIIKKAIATLTSVAIIVFVLCEVYLYFNRSHYEKVISPMIKEYFKTHYNADIKTTNNNLVCYTVEVDKKKQEECTNLLITTTSNNKHVLTVDDNYMGDDVNQKSFQESYKADFDNQFSDINIVYNEAELSYIDFYHDYNPYIDYINILPTGMNYSEMVATNKLTVQGKVIYQGELSIERVHYFLRSFSDNSEIYFIKLNQGLPNRLTIVRKNSYYDVSVANNLPLEENQNVIFYELDRNINGTKSITYKDVSTHGIKLSSTNKKYRNKKTTYKFMNGKYLGFEYDRPKRDEPAKEHYYILKFINNEFISNFVLFKGSRGNYTELDKEKYPLFVYMTLGSETYVIGNDSFGMAYKTEEKEGFLCNFGLC